MKVLRTSSQASILNFKFQSFRSRHCYLSCSAYFYTVFISYSQQFTFFPRNHPFTLHFIPFRSLTLSSKRFSIKEQLNRITRRINPNWNFLSFFHIRMSPMWKYMHYWHLSPFALIQIIMIFFKSGQVKHTTHKSTERPSSMNITCLTFIIEACPSETC